ncbi:hypothetical protein [Bradyrhizobium sp. CB3481]|uniref:hypothetical protein n=1 Tax=Bradyrhizobium sp. CB3481 TaxID=3039158 RepID=UPI0024B107AC|nr:hypothetical protein [Bradyrhizobium sp. CB3481]WFU13534.1 hypothetical protein QA643_19950 [Bradyrhizobium sp. CB3481]
MAKKSDHLGDLGADDAGGVLGGLLAEENELDRRTLWRVASWGVGATAAVILAVMANQSSLGIRREQVAAADLARQAQQIQTVAKETHNEARRLAAAIETLNTDRDRLYARVTGLEQGLESVTGAIARQGSAPAPAARAEPPAAQNQPPSPPVAPVATAPAAAPAPAASEPPTASAVAKDAAKTGTAKSDAAKADPAEPAKPLPATPLMAAPSMMAPPDPAAGRLVEPGKTPGAVIAGPIPDVVASASGDAEADDAPKVVLQRTEFGVDLGTANSVNGLRALWRGLLKSRSNAALAALRPIIVIKESTTGLGMQLRLVAGPLHDAGAAAKICAVMAENNRPCETTIFDGQRLSMDDPPAAAKPPARRRVTAKRAAAAVAAIEEVAKKPEAPPPPSPQPTLSSIFNKKNQQ